MSPLKTRILGRAAAVSIGVASFPFLLAGTLVLASAGRLQVYLVLAVGAALVGAWWIQRRSYDLLCARWSDEATPPRSPRWVPWRIRDLL